MRHQLDISSLLDAQIAEALAALTLDSATLSNETLPLIRADRAAQPFAPLSDRVACNAHDIESMADPVWPPQANRYGWDSYLGGLSGDAVPAYAAAARATDLGGLPPTFINVGALDGFSDEDADYVMRLRHAGVPCEFHLYPGAPHGLASMLPNTSITRRANRELEHWLSIQLHGEEPTAD